jgi:multidrug efflux pump subunit AcrB
MTGQDSPGADSQKLEALAKQLADLERQTAELDAALRRAASVRRLLTLVVVLVLGTYGYLFYSKGKAFADKDNLDRLQIELELSAQKNSAEIINHVQTLYEHTSPTISAAFAKQMKDDMPKITAMLGSERETLAINLKDRMDGLVRGHYNKAIDQHRGILAETFPSVKDDRDIEAMSENFKDAFKPLVKQHYGDKLQAEFDRMYKTWDTFPQDESKRTREELSQELYNLLFALMQEKLAAAAEERASSKSAPGASGS